VEADGGRGSKQRRVPVSCVVDDGGAAAAAGSDDGLATWTSGRGAGNNIAAQRQRPERADGR